MKKEIPVPKMNLMLQTSAVVLTRNGQFLYSLGLMLACLLPIKLVASIQHHQGFYSNQSQVSPGQKKLQKGEPYSFELTRDGIKIEGQYTLLRGGSLQWFRLPPEVWEDRIRQFKAMGFNTIDMYIAWNQIEPIEGEFNFTSPDIRRFLELARYYGLYVIVRPGPYITNEMDGGGLPAWLTRDATKRGYEENSQANLRTHDPDFIQPVRRYFQALNQLLKPYTAPHGGPIVLYTIENEYNWFERSFQLDRLFRYKGKIERPLFDELPTKYYFTALRDIVLETGIEVPIIACPGDGKISGMGDVEGVIPFPNIYEWANPGQPEEIAYDLLTTMRNPKKHGGIYQNYPSGSLELNRSAQELRRLTMGGLDTLMVFNVVGILQENYLNSLTLAARAGDEPPHWGPPNEPKPDWIGTIFDLENFDRIVSGFVAPNYGYFGNVIDYSSAISPSGVIRDLFHQFRRDNMFYDAVEPLLASAGIPERSGSFRGANKELVIKNTELGARQQIGKVHYWLKTSEGTAFISLLNQTGQPLEIGLNQIQFRGDQLPKYRPLTIPTAAESKLTYSHVLPYQLPIGKGFDLTYTTSEILNFRPFNDETLLILYGANESWGELRLQGQKLQLLYADQKVTMHEQDDESIIMSYSHQHGISAIFQNQSGEKLRILVTNAAHAGHFWFVRNGNHDVLIAGPDYIDELSSKENRLTFRYEYDDRAQPLLILSPLPFDLADHSQLAAYHPQTQISLYQRKGAMTLPKLPSLTDEVWLRSDLAESLPDFDARSWLQWKGEPIALEFLNIFQGRAWYRTEFDIPNVRKYKGHGQLYLESASDIVGIYVNGQYVSTVAPVGSEIDNRSINRRYRFAMLKPYLKSGRNVISFRTEIWGHGSFMFGRGHLVGTKARLPAIAYDGLKGLYGEARLDKINLQQWSVRSELTGEREAYYAAAPDLTEWQFHQGLPKLAKGDVLWYRSSFDTAALPDSDTLHAPIVLNLQGVSSKATIYLNGRMIGRWLSDSEWLAQGSWARPHRGMWVPLSADHFPLPREMMRPEGAGNDLVLVFEDSSHSDDQAGRIDTIELVYNQEGLRWNGKWEEFGRGVRGRAVFDLKFDEVTKLKL